MVQYRLRHRRTDDLHGDVAYRRRCEPVTRGKAFFAVPGEIHATPRVHRVGSFQALMIDSKVFAEYLIDRDIPTKSIEWRVITHRMSHDLARVIDTVFDVIRPASAATSMAAQSAAVCLFTALAAELLNLPAQPTDANAGHTAAYRIRELLHSDEGLSCDLDTLAQKTNMSRYQALRTFKNQYGLPPHAYQLCLKVARARELLRTEVPIATVATECGFADQSHLGRHFKKLVGVTPAQYASSVHHRTHNVVEPADLFTNKFANTLEGSERSVCRVART